MAEWLLLDAFCGVGGIAVGYARAGFTVVGVDKAPQPDYPFEFHQGDALEFIRDHGGEFHVTHASPPCQVHSTLIKGHLAQGRDHGHEDLVPDTRELLLAGGRPYVIENVMGAPLLQPQMLCGLSFGLKVFRHRLFESNVPLQAPKHPSHKGHYVKGWRHGTKWEGHMLPVYGNGGSSDKGVTAEWQEAMGIDWTTNRKRLSQAIPPAYGAFIGKQVRAHLYKEALLNGDL